MAYVRLECATLPFYARVISIERSKYLPTHNRKVPVSKNPTTLGGHLRRRRLQLGIFQSEAARRLGVSTVSLSRWECDKLQPKWTYDPVIISYLGYDPFDEISLGHPQGNETHGVAFFPDAGGEIVPRLRAYRLKHRLSRQAIADILDVSPKTIWGWESGRFCPSKKLEARLREFLGEGCKFCESLQTH